MTRSFNSRILAVFLLGFSSGLPFQLTHGSFQAWLYSEGISLEGLGLVSLLGLPYAVKFFWAPLVDRLGFPWLGRRRDWILFTQLLLVAAMGALSFVQPSSHLPLVAALAFALALFSATHDIVVDGYRVDILREEERGRGVALATLSYRLALLTTGAGALVLADRSGWPFVLRGAALIMAICAFFPFFVPRVDAAGAPKENSSWSAGFEQLFRRREAVSLLAFVMLYKFGDSFASNMSIPFMLQAGYSQSDIGLVAKGAGVGAAILGTLIGGLYLDAIGPKRALLWFGLLQIVSTLFYPVLSYTGGAIAPLFAVIGFENFTTGLGTSAFVAFLVGVCRKEHGATQYAVFSGLAGLTVAVGGAPAGYFVTAFGWAPFFFFSAVAGIPALILLSKFFERWERQS